MVNSDLQNSWPNGLYVENSDVIIRDCLFYNNGNTANENGGGIVGWSLLSLYITDSEFIENYA